MSHRATSVVLLSPEPASQAQERLAALLDVATGLGSGVATVLSGRVTDPPLRRLETATPLASTGGLIASSFEEIEVYSAIHMPSVEPDQADVIEQFRAEDPSYTHGWQFIEYEMLPVPDRLEEGWVARVGLARGLPHLSHEEFVRHWVEVHAPLVVDHGPGFRGYRLHEPVRPEMLAPWGGFVEQFYPSVEAWIDHDNAIFETKPAVRADLSTFLGEVKQFCAYDLRVLRSDSTSTPA